MTRINVIPVEQLSPKHLIAEKKEITRVFGYVKKICEKGHDPSYIDIPPEYTLGKGHVKFFYNKLAWICERYKQLYEEMRRRGYNPTLISEDKLMSGIEAEWYRNYSPTEDDLYINRYRLLKRDNDSFYCWYLEDVSDYISKRNLTKRLGS